MKKDIAAVFPSQVGYDVLTVVKEELHVLVGRAQEGDVRAFEALIERHLGQIRRFARAFSRADAEVDDLAQEALLRVYRNVQHFRFQSAFSTWLFSVVRSAFLDMRKGRAATRQAVEESIGEGEVDREGGSRPDELLEQAQERERVWSALRLLPVEFRTALVLFDIEGFTYDEVAAVEGVAVGTVKSRLHRGRAQLRALLDVGSVVFGREASHTTNGQGTTGPVSPSHVREKP